MKFQMHGQKNHHVVGWVRPFSAPLRRRVNATTWTAATGMAKASPRRRGVRSESPASNRTPASRMSVGPDQQKGSPA